MDLLDTLGAELDLAGEELDALVLVERALDEGRLDNALDTLGGLEQALGKAGTGHGHGESSAASTTLGLDDLVTTELNTVDELGELLTLDGAAVALADQWDDGDTAVATNDDNVLIGRVGVLDLGDESRGADDVEGGDTEQALRVVDALGLEDLGGDGDGRVDGIGNDEDVGLGGSIGDGLGQVTNNGGVRVEEVCRALVVAQAIAIDFIMGILLTITCHAGLARNTGRDENDLGALERSSEMLGALVVALDGALGVDMADIGGDTLYKLAIELFPSLSVTFANLGRP